MYLKSIRLRNLKCFSDATLNLPGPGDQGNWVVLLGENGTGKSTLLRAVAISLCGPIGAHRLVEDAEGYVRTGAPAGEIEATFAPKADAAVEWDFHFKVAHPPAHEGFAIFEPAAGYDSGHGGPQFRSAVRGAILAGYGAFRRPEPGPWEGPGEVSLYERFRTLFSDKVGLPALVEWLQRLDYLIKDPKARKADNLAQRFQVILAVINSLLPEDGKYRLGRVDANGVFFTGPDGETVPLSEMSDGYRTMFAVSTDLLRIASPLMTDLKNAVRKDRHTGRWVIDLEGIVLIDEVDAHLHPRWQREIGYYLQRAFPKVQFIVASHSPFVAQAASRGGVFVLRRDPGGNEVRIEPLPQQVTELPAEEILRSPAFDLESTQSLEADHLRQEHAELSAKAQSTTLTAPERKRLRELDQRVKAFSGPVDPTEQSLEEMVRLLREARDHHD